MSKTKSKARYILRFDDICPTMNWTVWEKIEALLDKYSVCPILAVVPDNVDANLMVEPARTDFWEKVSQWQAKGYAIALHGYQHKYVNKNPGLMRLTKQSEFSGLAREEQEEKIRQGLEIFSAHGIRADAWVAPSHSFDQTTLDVLQCHGVDVVSDGLWRRPVLDARGMTWVPQQLWGFRPKDAGVWTVCFHHNDWSPEKIEIFGKDLDVYASEITDLTAIRSVIHIQKLALSDRLEASADWVLNHSSLVQKIGLKRVASRFKSFFRTGKA